MIRTLLLTILFTMLVLIAQKRPDVVLEAARETGAIAVHKAQQASDAAGAVMQETRRANPATEQHHVPPSAITALPQQPTDMLSGSPATKASDPVPNTAPVADEAPETVVPTATAQPTASTPTIEEQLRDAARSLSETDRVLNQ
jgi:hypothetical protein